MSVLSVCYQEGKRAGGFVAWALAVAVVLLIPSGCRVCPVLDDEAYGYYGGITTRTDPYRGRVGSAFDDGSQLEREEIDVVEGVYEADPPVWVTEE